MSGRRIELITVQFETPYKDEAAKIVEALVKSYKEYQSSQRNSSASEVPSRPPDRARNQEGTGQQAGRAQLSARFTAC
jgi:hypothetical protein